MKKKKLEWLGDRRIHKWLLVLIGLFLLFDGVLSLYFGNSCLFSCFNNSPVGNIVRWVRLIIGLYLIYLGVKR